MATNKKSLNIGHAKYYINRELSMLDFQQRVLEEATDPANPLLERIKFLAIVESNMDGFFMVRVGGLRLQQQAGVRQLSIDQLGPAEQLAAIRKKSLSLLSQAREYFNQTAKPELDEAGIHLLDFEELSRSQKKKINAYFDDVVFPVLTPLAVDPGHPFPHISNLSLNLAILLEDQDGLQRFARLKIPASLPRLVPIKRSSGGVKKDGTVPHNHYFVWLEQLIAANLEKLFPGMQILGVHPFRVTRYADVSTQELEASDLLEMIEQGLRQRRFGPVVCLAVLPSMPEEVLHLIASNLSIDDTHVYKLDRPLGMNNLMELHAIDRFDLKYPSFVPSVPSTLDLEESEASIFSIIRQKDLLLHHPYNSFEPVVQFLRAAARDPNVLAIKQTLYRVGSNSPVVQELLAARRDFGKQVAVLVELKARFDEENNIEWARALESEGIHVTYGMMELKTHCKISLVVRQEGDHIRRYVHLGTGNYNHVTARLYEDIGMFTANEEIGADATDLFNYLTGYSSQTKFRQLLVAPINLRQRLSALIEREIKHQKAGRPAHLILKTNALIDKPLIQQLYKASQAGVQVDLIVRGMCSLRPGIPGLSENIRVISILGRFLEHSRIYYFKNGGQEEVLLGSADMMPRNLNGRVEVLFPVLNESLIQHLRTEVLDTYLRDNLRARRMQADGDYLRLSPNGAKQSTDTQDRFIKFYSQPES